VSELIVSTKGLGKSFQKGRVVALNDINISVHRGEFVVILGCSGSGKTTLLNLIGALDMPTAGTIVVDGVETSRIPNMKRFRAETVGFVFQLHNLISSLSALENVQLPLFATKMKAGERREKATHLLESVGLQDRMNHRPPMLSGGERQRVAIARALANSPPLLLVDEPTGNLDPGTAHGIAELLCCLNRDVQTTVLVATHDSEVAKQGDRMIVLDNGRVVESPSLTPAIHCAISPGNVNAAG
jgi:putative ABC transport system ATP-binding protein